MYTDYDKALDKLADKITDCIKDAARLIVSDENGSSLYLLNDKIQQFNCLLTAKNACLRSGNTQ